MRTSYINGRNMQNGYIALISVLVAGALMLLVGVGSALRGIDTENSLVGEESSFRAELLADACAEEALMKLKANLNYAGNETIIVEGGATCTIGALSGAGNTNRTISTQAVDNNYIRKVLVSIAQVNPSPTILSWKTVP